MPLHLHEYLVDEAGYPVNEIGYPEMHNYRIKFIKDSLEGSDFQIRDSTKVWILDKCFFLQKN